jgi:hypothetical protein
MHCIARQHGLQQIFKHSVELCSLCVSSTSNEEFQKSQKSEQINKMNGIKNADMKSWMSSAFGTDSTKETDKKPARTRAAATTKKATATVLPALAKGSTKLQDKANKLLLAEKYEPKTRADLIVNKAKVNCGYSAFLVRFPGPIDLVQFFASIINQSKQISGKFFFLTDLKNISSYFFASEFFNELFRRFRIISLNRRDRYWRHKFR